MTNLASGTRVRRGDGLVSSDLDGEIVLLSVEAGRYYSLDEIGTRVWALLENPATISEVCDRLLEEFDVDRETCEHDVLEFLEPLVRDGVVLIEGEAGA